MTNPVRTRLQRSSNPPTDAEYLRDYCKGYLLMSFNNLVQKETFRNMLFRSDSIGSGCWIWVKAYVCHYPDRNPLYSIGLGVSVEGSPEQCEALRQARSERLNELLAHRAGRPTNKDWGWKRVPGTPRWRFVGPIM